jgi:hypothetical protein
MHVHHVGRHLVQVVVNSRDFEPAAQQARHHRRHLRIEQDKVPHDHRAVAHLLECRIRSEREPGLDGNALDGDGQIRSRHSDAEDVAGLHLARLAERLLHRLPVRISGRRETRRGSDESEQHDRTCQPLGSHGRGLLLLNTSLGAWTLENVKQRIYVERNP